jgi:hypothetical protein
LDFGREKSWEVETSKKWTFSNSHLGWKWLKMVKCYCIRLS